jgi:hypothetical protein
VLGKLSTQGSDIVTWLHGYYTRLSNLKTELDDLYDEIIGSRRLTSAAAKNLVRGPATQGGQVVSSSRMVRTGTSGE